MNQKSKPTSPSAMQVKKWRTIINIEEKLGVISKLAEGNRFFTYAVMLGVIILAYVQLMKVLMELQRVLSRELSVCVARLSLSSLNQ